MRLLLEIRQPFFFAQDDNFDLFMPMALMGGRSLLSGALCTFSPYLYCGSPVATVPQSMLLYPPTYVSFLLSKFVLGSKYYTMDALCVLHLVAAYFIAYWVARYLGCGRCWLQWERCHDAIGLLPDRWPFLVHDPRGGGCVCGSARSGDVASTSGACQALDGVHRCVRGMVVLHRVSTVVGVYADVLRCCSCGSRVGGRVGVEAGAFLVPAFVAGLGISAPLWLPQVLETIRFIGNRFVRLGGGIGDGILCLFFHIRWSGPHIRMIGATYALS